MVRNMDKMNLVEKNESIGYEARTDRHTVCARYRCDGMTLELMLQHFLKDLLGNMEKLNGRAKTWSLEEDREQGFMSTCLHVKSPPMVSDRVLISNYYFYID